MDTNEFFENLLAESEKKADALDDQGHLNLVKDVEDLLFAVKFGTFHDFHRNGMDAPKIELHKAILGIDKKMQQGRYDN